MNIDFRPVDLLTSARRDALRTGTCSLCGGSATTFRDELSRRENRIAGTCQRCQDDLFGEDEV